MAKGLSIIVVNYGAPDLLMNFLKSARDSPDAGLISEVIIVDNGYPHKGDSRDTVDASSFPFKIKFVQNPESSYASGVNKGVAVTSEETLIVSNNDIEWIPGVSIQPLLNHLWQDPRIGVVGPQLVSPDGSWQRSYGRFPSCKEGVLSLTMLDTIWHGIIIWSFRHNWLPKRPKIVEYIDGAFMVIRRSCFDELGGFDESYSFYGEDTSFCWRAHQAGWKVVFVPSVRILHVRGGSSTKKQLGDYTVQLFKAKQRFVKEHFGPRHAIWYAYIMKAALFERKLFYSFVAQATGSSSWRTRAEQAKKRWEAVRAL